MIFYDTIYILIAGSIFFVNIKNYKKLNKEYKNKIEEHILFIIVLLFFFIEMTILTVIYLILKLLMKN